jgi:hypothetical protein
MDVENNLEAQERHMQEEIQRCKVGCERKDFVKEKLGFSQGVGTTLIRGYTLLISRRLGAY